MLETSGESTLWDVTTDHNNLDGILAISRLQLANING